VLGAVFPVQMQASTVRCEFSTAEVDRVRRALDEVAEELGIGAGDVTLTWVHTHPALSVFLSGTDRDTAAHWKTLDPQFTPIVIDASRRDLADQIGVFDANGRQLGPMAVVDGLVDESVAEQLNTAVLQTYRAEGQPVPLVLLAGSAS
jgi:hypothetical protein